MESHVLLASQLLSTADIPVFAGVVRYVTWQHTGVTLLLASPKAQDGAAHYKPVLESRQVVLQTCQRSMGAGRVCASQLLCLLIGLLTGGSPGTPILQPWLEPRT